MPKFEKILVSTDFSECSEPAVSYAKSLGEALSAELYVLHVMEEPFDYKGYGLSPTTILSVQEDQRAIIEGELGKVEEAYGGDRTSLQLREGVPYERIVEVGGGAADRSLGHWDSWSIRVEASAPRQHRGESPAQCTMPGAGGTARCQGLHSDSPDLGAHGLFPERVGGSRVGRRARPLAGC